MLMNIFSQNHNILDKQESSNKTRSNDKKITRSQKSKFVKRKRKGKKNVQIRKKTKSGFDNKQKRDKDGIELERRRRRRMGENGGRCVLYGVWE